MSARAARWGIGAALGLASFYITVLASAGAWQHLADQTRQDWWLLLPIVVVLGVQVAVTVELHNRLLCTPHRRRRTDADSPRAS